MLKANTEDYIIELKLLAHHIQEQHGSKLQHVKEPVLLIIELPSLQKVYFLISSEGISYKKELVETNNRIAIKYVDLMRVVEKPSRIARYILEGRVKVFGNYREVLSTLQRMF
ncbi:MAG: hypothetical protein NZ526_00335 [Aquificaceae bacterium]|nr:hypothetical protein [Aquificaceae bacterium]